MRRAFAWHPPLLLMVVVMGDLGAVSAVGYVLDPREVTGAPVWGKPLKFALSFALYGVTFAWLISRLRRPRVRRVAFASGTVIAVAAVGEMVAIVTQVVRGRQSHFNVATTTDMLVFNVMGVLVTLILLATIAVGIALLLEAPTTDRLTTWAVRLGLVISTVGMSVGFLMLRPGVGQGPGSPVRGAHGVGVADGGPGLPLVGWATTGGDLRVPHFIGLHALQVLPLLAIALAAAPVAARLGHAARVRLMVVGAAGYAGLFALTLAQALRGQAVTAPDGWTAAALGVGLAALAATVVAILRGDGAPPPAVGPAGG